MSGLPQVEHGIRVRQAARQPTAGDREVHLRRAELEVVAPLALRIEAERDHGQQVPAWVGVGQVEDVLGGQQASVGERRVAPLEHLVRLGQRRRVPAGQVGADRRAGRPGPEHRPVPDVPGGGVRSAVRVVGLGQAPDVVVAHGLGVPLPDAHLVVQGLRGVVPHPQQPVRTELGLRGEVRRGGTRTHLVREVTDAREQHVDRVARGLHELQVVPRVPPPSGRVDPHTERREIAREAAGVVGGRRRVGHRVLVVQVAGRVPQGVGDIVRAITLGLIEAEGIRQGTAVHGRRRVDPEARRRRGDGPGHRDRVRPARRDG